MLGRGFLGRAAVLTGSFIKRAVSFEPKRVVIPTVAAKNPQARKTLLAIQKAFRAAYRRALDAWKAGVRDIVFPFGHVVDARPSRRRLRRGVDRASSLRGASRRWNTRSERGHAALTLARNTDLGATGSGLVPTGRCGRRATCPMGSWLRE